MNTDSSAHDYWTRCYKELGQTAADAERVAIWCYDNPPHRPLPKPSGAREANVFVSRRIVKCLSLTVGSFQNVDALVDSILLLWIKDNMAELWTMYERHEQEEKMVLAERREQSILAELRRNEPSLDSCERTLQPQEDAPLNEIPR